MIIEWLGLEAAFKDTWFQPRVPWQGPLWAAWARASPPSEGRISNLYLL